LRSIFILMLYIIQNPLLYILTTADFPQFNLPRLRNPLASVGISPFLEYSPRFRQDTSCTPGVYLQVPVTDLIEYMLLHVYAREVLHIIVIPSTCNH
jgi:hypothetical protein